MNSSVNMPIALTGGMVYLLMALTVWVMLRKTAHARVVGRWTLGSVCAGLSMLGLASRILVPLPLAVGGFLPAMLACSAMLMQTDALRMHQNLPPVWRRAAVPLLVVALVLLVLGWLDLRNWFFVVTCATLASLSGLLTWQALRVARQERLTSARLLAWSQGALAVALTLRALGVALGVSPYRFDQGGVLYAVVHCAAVLAALYGSLGFMGLMLEITRRAEAQARDGQVAEATRRQSAEQTASELRTLLHQRDTLAAERERLLQVLAHEIRQPLHNASGALQAAGLALRAPRTSGVDQVALRLGRAEAVLGDVRSVLDNTLAVATLLGRRAPLVKQEVALDFLVDLTLGDLDEARRARVQVQWLTDQRSADCEPGLMRLALRNLLANAFNHGGPGVAVRVVLTEETEPQALAIHVIDNGIGATADRLAAHAVDTAAMEAGQSAAQALAPGPADLQIPAPSPARPPPARGRSMGLRIVHQVMALHGGQLVLRAGQPHGLKASLLLPLPQD